MTVATTPSMVIIATLTPGQKTNGFRVQVWSKSKGGLTGGAASFTNVQTTLELI